MIAEVVAYVERRGPPPPDLQRVHDWEAWGRLPEAGGIRDQLAGELERMLLARNVEAVWEVYLARPAGWEKVIARRDAQRIIELVLNEGWSTMKGKRLQALALSGWTLGRAE